MYFGNGVEAILQDITHKNPKLQAERRHAKLLEIVSDTEKAKQKAATKQFAAPAPTKVRRAK